MIEEQDLPNLDSDITKLPQDIRHDLAELGKSNLFFFAKGILKYKDMTEKCHGPLCVFTNHNPGQFKLILMPRDHYKSTVITISGNLQKVVQDPEQRILIANESATNAERFLRAIREHAENNVLFRSLYSGLIPKETRKVRWNDQELTFNRKGFYPEPTFDSIGMTGAFTSRHYSHINIDDPISEEAIKSEKVMEDTINRLRAVLALLTKPEKDTIWIVGTRWALHDVYSWFEANLGPRLVRFARGVFEDGEPIFPELMGHEILAIKRQMLGEYKFSCLYMNNPRNEDLQDLNIDDVKYWEFADSSEDRIRLFDRHGAEERIVRLDQLVITTTVDLAAAEKMSSDRNAVVTTGVSPWGDAIVLEAWGKRCTPLELCDKLFEVKERWKSSKFGIEAVAYQKAFKYFLREEANRKGVYLNIVDIKASGKKEVRIRGLQPVMATGHFYVRANQALLLQEISEFPLGQHDDVIDCTSMQLQLWPNRLSPEHWEKMKIEERKILSQIRRGTLSASQGAKKLDFDFSDGDDPDEEVESPSDSWSDYIIN